MRQSLRRFRLRGCLRLRVGFAGLLVIFCSLLGVGYGASVDVDELREALKAQRKQNDDLRKSLDECKSRELQTSNQLARVQNDLRNSRLNLISESEEGMSAQEWRRLLQKSLKTLQEREEQIKQLEDRLASLRNAVQDAMKTAQNVDAKKRLVLEKELRETALKIDKAAPQEAQLFKSGADVSALSKASVLGVELDLGVAALAVGKKDGARVGMPFLALRGKDVLAVLTLVEVREKTSLALIEQMERDKPIREGDFAMIRKN